MKLSNEILKMKKEMYGYYYFRTFKSYEFACKFMEKIGYSDQAGFYPRPDGSCDVELSQYEE